MARARHGIGLIFGISALSLAAAAAAQENLDLGKSPAQLYASDCAICHKSPRGLSKTGGIFGVESFLREHYTASRQSAAAIAAYLRTIDAEPAPADRRRASRPKRGADPKPASAKPSDTKPSDTKPSDTKPSDAKASDTKPSDAKASDTKPPEPAPADKPADKKPPEDKATAANASVPETEAAGKPAAKPEQKPE